MTREEAITRIQEHMIIHKMNEPRAIYISEALDMAIKALEQPTIIRCKDCKFAHLTYDGDVKYCDVWSPDESIYIDGDNFCSSAERKVDNKE